MNSRISTVSKVKIKMEIHSGFSKFVVVLVATLTFSTQNNVSAFTPGMNSRISTVTTSTTSLSMRPTKTKTDKKESFQFKELGMSLVPEADGEERWEDVSKKIELIGLGVWLASISGFILVNNFVGPWPEVMKTVPERVFFLSHMIGGMLFGGGIILTTCIERLVAKSNNPSVLQFWFDKVPALDGLIVVPALTISMISGTGLSIVRYGGLNVAPPHVDAIFWTLIMFMAWWATTDLTTQGTALKAVERMFERSEAGEDGLETPKVVVDRHVSNVVSCFFILLLYSMMVFKPGTIYPWPWSH